MQPLVCLHERFAPGQLTCGASPPAGKGSWSGYGPRPRGKGIVDQCCKSSGCELYHLEMYCAKPKAKQLTTRSPTTTSTTATHATTAVLDMVRLCFSSFILIGFPPLVFILTSSTELLNLTGLCSLKMCFGRGFWRTWELPTAHRERPTERKLLRRFRGKAKCRRRRCRV